MGELNRLVFLQDETICSKLRVPEGLRISARLAWSDRIAKHAEANDEGFFEDLKEANRRRHLQYQKSVKDCLAEAYLVLAKPEGITNAWPGPEVDFLNRHGGKINTETVKEYALYLWANCRQNKPSNQLELKLDGPSPILSRSQWSRLFQELGLTPKYLPRAHGGRPKAKKGRNSAKPGAKQGISKGKSSKN
jgi:hypothetical protein